MIPGAESPEEFSGRPATGSRPFAFLGADNGSISSLVVHADGSWLLRTFNEIRHLGTPTGPVGWAPAD